MPRALSMRRAVGHAKEMFVPKEIGPRRARSLSRTPWCRRSPDGAARDQATLPLPPSASLAARSRFTLDLPLLKRADKPARNALRPWLLPETFSSP